MHCVILTHNIYRKKRDLYNKKNRFVIHFFHYRHYIYYCKLLLRVLNFGVCLAFLFKNAGGSIMEILDFSKERGIHAIFNGYGKQAYIFHSSFYGVIGYADIMDEPGTNDITVDVYLGENCHYWYWSLRAIVSRGIKKSENRFINKNIKFIYHYLNNKDIGSGVTDNVFKYDNVLKVSTYEDIIETSKSE